MINDDESRENRVIAYRMYAKKAADFALNAPRLEVCDGYLKLASVWDKLADDIDSQTSSHSPVQTSTPVAHTDA
jgi:hypothetical protein